MEELEKLNNLCINVFELNEDKMLKQPYNLKNKNKIMSEVGHEDNIENQQRDIHEDIFEYVR